MAISVKEYFKTLWSQLDTYAIFDGAAALAYYFVLSIFPAFIVLFALISYVPVENLQEQILSWLSTQLPEQSAKMFTDIIKDVAPRQSGGALSFGLVTALWAATTGMVAVIRYINVAHHVEEHRNFFKLRLVSLGLTLLIGLVMVVTFVFLILWAQLIDHFFPGIKENQTLYLGTGALRFGILIIGLMATFAMIYYFGPNMKLKFRFITPGSVFAVVGFILSSWAFSIYVDNFGEYNAIYGSIGAVIVLMIWFYILGLLLITGAQFNEVLRIMKRGAKPRRN